MSRAYIHVYVYQQLQTYKIQNDPFVSVLASALLPKEVVPVALSWVHILYVVLVKNAADRDVVVRRFMRMHRV